MADIVHSKGSVFPPLAKGTLRLYSMQYCPFSHRARLVLAHKGIDHEIVNIDLDNKPEWILERNPRGQVPTLEQDDKVVYGSAACCRYLDLAFPGPRLTPHDVYVAARDDMISDDFFSKVGGALLGRGTRGLAVREDGRWSSHQSSEWHRIAARRPLPLRVLANDFKVWKSGGRDQEARQAVLAALKQLDDKLTGWSHPYIGEDEPALVDFVLWPWFEMLEVMGEIAPEVVPTATYLPALFRWIHAMKTLPAVKSQVTDYAHDKEYLKAGEPCTS